MLKVRIRSFPIIGNFRNQLTAMLLNTSAYLLSLVNNIGSITKVRLGLPSPALGHYITDMHYRYASLNDGDTF